MVRGLRRRYHSNMIELIVSSTRGSPGGLLRGGGYLMEKWVEIELGRGCIEVIC
jgi:hypothetical protein